MWFHADEMSRGLLRGPPSRMVRSHASVSARMPGARPSSLRSSQSSKDGRRSSSSTPISWSTSAVRPALRPRACCNGMISEYRTVSPGSCRDSTMISARRTAKRSPRRQPRDSPRCQAR